MELIIILAAIATIISSSLMIYDFLQKKAKN